MYYQSNAIILKSKDYRESEKIVTIFTEREGKIRAIAKGTKKPNSSLRACVQPFVLSSLYFSQGREMDLITQGKLLDFFGNSREDITRTLYCIYMMELLDKSLMDKIKLPGLFKTTLDVLHYINQSGYQPAAIRFFEMKLLINLGYQPILLECVKCGRKQNSFHYTSAAEGGVVCNDCKDIKDVSPLSGETLAILKLLSNASIKIVDRLKISDPAQAQMEQLLESYLEYHLERRFNLKNAIRKLKSITQL